MSYETANRVWQYSRRILLGVLALYLVSPFRLAPQFAHPVMEISESQSMLLEFSEFLLASILGTVIYPLVEGDRLRRLRSAVAAAFLVLVLSLVITASLQALLRDFGPHIYTTVTVSGFLLLSLALLVLMGPFSTVARCAESDM